MAASGGQGYPGNDFPPLNYGGSSSVNAARSNAMRPIARVRQLAQPPGQHAQPPGQRAQPQPPSAEQLEAPRNLDRLADECIRQLNVEQQHVSVQAVEGLMCRRLGVERLPIRRVTDLGRVKELDRELNRVSTYIHAYNLNPVGTLHDLGVKLAAGAASKKDAFHALGLGPLTKHPLVYETFKCWSERPVVEISPTDVLSHLRKFMERRRGNSERIAAEEFLKLLAKEYDCEDDVYMLGVKIRSIPLLIQEIARARRDANGSMREARERIQAELEQELHTQFAAVKRHLGEALDRRSDRGVALRKKYMHMRCLEVLADVINCCHEYLRRDVKDKVIPLLNLLSRDHMASQLFQLALCSAQYDADESYNNAAIAQQSAGSVAAGQLLGSVPGNPVQTPKTYNRKEVFEAIRKSFIRRKVDRITLELLKLIEEDTRKALKVKDFTDFGHGSFIAFICRSIKDFEDCGISLALAGDGSVKTEEQKKCVLAFIRHYCSIFSPGGSPGVEHMSNLADGLCQQFDVASIRELGASSIQSLLGLATNTAGTTAGMAMISQELPVLYEDACIRIKFPESGSQHDALQCIVNTPLLNDISEWTHWKLLFHDKCGDLAKFIAEKHRQVNMQDFGANARFGLRALLTHDGRLLRLPATGSSIDTFAACVKRFDGREAAAHLTVLVCVKGVNNVSTALLASYVQKNLLCMAATSIGMHSSNGRDDTILYSTLTNFVLTAITLIPIHIATYIVGDVFIAPFADAVGSQAKAEQLLATMSRTQNLTLKLARLGLALGISSWSSSHDSNLEPETLADISVDEPIEVPPAEQSTKDDGQPRNEPTSVGDADSEILEAPAPSLVEKQAVSQPASAAEEKHPTDDVEQGHCLAVINDIRKKYNVDTPDEESDATMNLKKQLGNSLERLSRELYNSDTHFVLELIQNADDNSYKSGSTPALLFVIDNNSIVLYNNEEGFTERDIRAVCAIGDSTKGKHKKGYIGQKGIGFKSVFTVTNRPEVHSNGYHICFDRSKGTIGYILPTWLSAEPPVAPKSLSCKGSKWTTTIVLPLKDDTDEDSFRTRSLTSSFLDVKSILLLFLHRLQEITFVNKVQNKIVVMKRQDLEKHLLRLHCDNASDLWLVSRMTLDTSEELNVDVESTELSLAFPVYSETKLYEPYLTKPDKKPKKQQTFAYLPLREFGFKFVLQADFEIPSSRQDVRHDSKWNEWLREAIPHAFLRSRDLFLELKGLDEVAATIYFLKFVPLPGETTGFFEPTSHEIIEKLCQANVMPVKGESGQISWKRPSEVMICPKEVQAILPASVLTGKLGLSYLMSNVIEGVGEDLLLNIGVKNFDCNTAIDVLMTLYDDYRAKNEDFPMEYCARWLSTMYHFLKDGYQLSFSKISTIAAMKLYWLSNRNVVNITDNAVFLPLTANPDVPGSPLHRLLETDMAIISKDFLNCLDNLANAQLKEVLQILGVRTLSATDIIEGHILPVLQSEAWKTKSVALLVTYVQFLFDEWASNRDQEWLAATKKCIRLLTEHRSIECPAEKDIYLTVHYHNCVNLRDQYPAYQWCLVSPQYIAGYPAEKTRWWREFLLIHGLKEMFEVESQRSVRTRADLEKTAWSDFISMIPGSDNDELELEDFVSPLVCQLLDSKDATTVTNVYRELSNNWDGKYRQYIKATAFSRSLSCKITSDLPSTFLLMLRSREWVPCFAFVLRNSVESTWHLEKKMLFGLPSKAWLHEPKLESLLAHTVTYLDTTNVRLSQAFCKDLELRTALTCDDLLNHLREWSSRNASALDGRQPFVSCRRHLVNVYNHLFDNLPPEYADIFRQESLIFVPNCSENHKDTDLASGRFLTSKELRWADPYGLFGKYCPEFVSESTGEKLSYAFVENCYPMQIAFFVNWLKVEPTPLLREYCLLLQYIAQDGAGSISDKTMEHVTIIYEELGKKCLATTTPSRRDIDWNYAGQLRGHFTRAAVLSTMKGSWTSLGERLLFDDLPEVGEVFRREKVAVQFVKFSKQKIQDKQSYEHLSAFCMALGIRNLSSLYDKDCNKENLRACPVAQNYVAKLLPLVQRFMLSKKKFAGLYRQLITPSQQQGSDDFEVFPQSRLRAVYQVKSIEVVMRLQGWDDCIVKERKECDYDHGERSIFMEYTIVKNIDDMCYHVHEMLRLVLRIDEASNTSLAKHLHEFLSAAKEYLIGGHPKTEDEFVKRHELGTLAEDDLLWTIPSLPEVVPEPEQPPAPSAVENLEESIQEPLMFDAAPAGESSSGLTCWPPRQSEAGQVTKSSRGTGAKQELPEFAKNVPPPPSGVSVPLKMVIVTSTNPNPLPKVSQADETNISHDKVAQNKKRDGAMTTVTDCAQKTADRGQVNRRGAQTCDEPLSSTGSDGTTMAPSRQAAHASNSDAKTAQPASIVQTVVDPATSGIASRDTGAPLVADPAVGMDFSQLQCVSDAVPLEQDISQLLASLNPQQLMHLDSTGDHAVGYRGEWCIFHYLTKKYEKEISNGQVEIVWVNEQAETGRAYDLAIHDIASNTTNYIEVKSTMTEDKCCMEISISQLQLALSSEDKYSIYRVYNAGAREVTNIKLRILRNIARLLREKKVGLFIVV